MARSLAQYFAIYNHEICPISKTILVQTIVNDKMAKSDSKFRQILYLQIVTKWPNLVTLIYLFLTFPIAGDRTMGALMIVSVKNA